MSAFSCSPGVRLEMEVSYKRKWISFLSVILIIKLLSTSVNCVDDFDYKDEYYEDRSKNEIKEFVTSPDLDNEITTNPSIRYEQEVEDANKGTPKPPSSDIKDGSNSGTTSGSKKNKIDTMDQYLLDGILDIVDEKFSTLNTRLMTMERGMNNLQYYNVRSFRVVNTHLHAVDTILHSLHNQLTQNENQNLLLEQAIGSVKTEIADLESMNNGVFQAIEQNIVHFHSDMQNRVNEVKQGLEHMNYNIDQLRNETGDLRISVDGLKQEQYNIRHTLETVENVNSEILQATHTVLNVSLTVHATAESLADNSLTARKTSEFIARNVSSVFKNTEEIGHRLTQVLANVSLDNLVKTADEPVDKERAVRDFPYANSVEQISCARMLDILDKRLKNINVTLSESSIKQSKDCANIPNLDQKEFNNQSSQLIKALGTVNENVFQSVTLYRHTGNLIERLISETELIASEQFKLREDLMAYLLNGTSDLFNRSMPDFSDYVGKTFEKPETPRRALPEDDKCAISKPILEEMGQLSRNGTQLVELLSDLALSSSSNIRKSLAKLDHGISSLNKFKEETLNNLVVNKVEAFSREEKNAHLKDIQNKTELIYLLAEAIASNTGWIPFVYHRVMFVENQVNKTLNYITNIDVALKEMKQKANMAFIFKPRNKTKDKESQFSNIIPTDDSYDSTTSSPRSTRPISTECSNKSSTFDNMMLFVYKTNQRINRLIPGLTNLLGEPEPYISLIDGESDREGRVEIYNRGQWGTIPGEFSHVEASYVCRKLGYLGGVFAGNGFFGAGSGPFLALNVTCLRTRWCTAVNAVTHPEEYSHESDVGVICDHMLRLMTTNDEEEQEVTRHSGKLEIYHQNSWRPVCFHGWGRMESSVVCKQLGFREGAASGVRDENLRDVSWMRNITCTGRENRLDACTHEFKFNGCKENEFVSMICS